MKKVNLILIYSILLICLAGIVVILKRGSVKNKVIREASKELKKWQGISETSPQASQWLIDYWQSAGRMVTASQMQSPNFHQAYPWSSAFISYLFYKAGAKEHFPYSASHSGYFQLAKQNRNNPKANLRGFRITEYAPKLGDLVIYSRTQGKGYDTSGHFAAHGELVIEVGKGYIKTAGGNVSNTAKESTYQTDLNGFLKGNRVSFFMVIENNIR